MILTLEVTGPQAAQLGAAARKTFDEVGGTIGRLSSNYWVLAHPYVSSRHALIRYADGRFTIEDTKSANGVFINSPEHRLSPGQQHVLKTGDAIFIDPFEIRATLEVSAQRARATTLPADPFALDDVFAPPPSKTSVPYVSAVEPGREALSSEEVDPMNLLGFDAKRAPAPPVPRAADLAGRSALSDQYRAPAVPLPTADTPSHGSLIPEDYNPLLSDDQSIAAPPPPARPTPRSSRATPTPGETASQPPHARPRPTSAGLKRPADVLPPPARSQPPPAAPADAATPVQGKRTERSSSPRGSSPQQSAGELDLSAVLAGAGLDASAVTPELARSFGQILRVVVSGLMDVLQARQRIKDEFGMRLTTFRPADNNPLKFSANVEDALHNLLIKRNAAYLGPVEAFEDAFHDVRNHQMAMLAGVRQAFETMLAEFDPARLQEEFDRQGKKGSLLSVPAKMRYWEQYRDKFGDMVKDAEASFAELFGDEFARAYEEQLERLKAQSRANKR